MSSGTGAVIWTGGTAWAIACVWRSALAARDAAAEEGVEGAAVVVTAVVTVEEVVAALLVGMADLPLLAAESGALHPRAADALAPPAALLADAHRLPASVSAAATGGRAAAPRAAALPASRAASGARADASGTEADPSPQPPRQACGTPRGRRVRDEEDRVIRVCV